MLAPMTGGAEGQDVGEKMAEELPLEERSARMMRRLGEPTPEERSTRERICRETSGGFPHLRHVNGCSFQGEEVAQVPKSERQMLIQYVQSCGNYSDSSTTEREV